MCDVKVKKVFMRLHISRHFLEETSVPSSCMYCGHIDILAWHVLQEHHKTSLALIDHFNVLFVIIFFALTLWKIIMLRVTSALPAQII